MTDPRPFDMWVGMPRFNQQKVKEIKAIARIEDGSSVFIRFRDSNDLAKFAMHAPIRNEKGEFPFFDRGHLALVSKQKITGKTKSIWFPFKSHWGGVTEEWRSTRTIQPRYPVYIVSKGRWHNGLTTKALAEMSVKHYIVCEDSERDSYRSTMNEFAEILILPKEYLSNYDACDDLGDARSKGPGAARNFCIDHSTAGGFSRHWVMDDNLDAFHYLTDNEKLEVKTGATLAYAEDFVDRYENIPVSGFNYYSFCKKGDAVPPLVLNTRIYSCLLIENGAGYRWRGRYNEDTDLSLRVLKDGNCTLQFNAFLCGKVTTQRMSGGNTKEFYSSEGTRPKSEMIEKLHPDVAKVVWKFSRWHHHVDYRKFKANQPILTDKKIKFSKYELIKNPKPRRLAQNAT
jgi:hypothetical protein